MCGYILHGYPALIPLKEILPSDITCMVNSVAHKMAEYGNNSGHYHNKLDQTYCNLGVSGQFILELIYILSLIENNMGWFKIRIQYNDTIVALYIPF